MDCREWLDIKQYEFLMNYFMRRQRELALADLNEPYSYDGFSRYDQLYQQVVKEAEVASIECFGEPAQPSYLPIYFISLNLSLAGKRPRLKSPKALQ
ncbi:hypothetical protein [Alishewanella longhuensis]